MAEAKISVTFSAPEFDLVRFHLNEQYNQLLSLADDKNVKDLAARQAARREAVKLNDILLKLR